MAVLLVLPATAQTERVGVNTRTPVSTLDVKGVNSSTPLQYWRNSLNNILVSILSSGNVGIGTSTPTAKLEVNSPTQGAVKIVDGTQGAGKVLTSDAAGVGTWQSPKTDIILATLGSGVNIPADANQWYYTGSYITLPPGRWIVNVMMLFTVENPSETRNYNIWLRSTFQDDTSTATLMGGRYKYSADLAATGVYVSGQMSPAQVSGIVSLLIIPLRRTKTIIMSAGLRPLQALILLRKSFQFLETIRTVKTSCTLFSWVEALGFLFFLNKKARSLMLQTSGFLWMYF